MNEGTQRKKNTLTDKQERFCVEYVKCGDASLAYRVAYDCSRMKPQTVNRNAFQLLNNNKIATRITELKKRAMAAADLTVDRVMLEVVRLAFNDPRKVFDSSGRLLPVHEWPDDVAAAISSIEIDEIDIGGAVVGHTKKVKFWDKGKQIELASKLLGMIIEKKDLSVSGKDGKPVPVMVLSGINLDEICSKE